MCTGRKYLNRAGLLYFGNPVAEAEMNQARRGRIYKQEELYKAFKDMFFYCLILYFQ